MTNALEELTEKWLKGGAVTHLELGVILSKHEQAAEELEAMKEAVKALREFGVAEPIGVSSMWLPAFEKARVALARIDNLETK